MQRTRCRGVDGNRCGTRRSRYRAAPALRRRRPSSSSTRRSRPTRSRRTRRRSTRRIRTSRSSGCATRPASSRRSCSPKRRIRRPTSSSACRRRAWRCSTTKACCSRTRRRASTRYRPKYRDPKNPPAWVGMDVYGAAICFNTVEAQKPNLPKPETWKDLTKPVYKGKIVMPNPASSGTGFLDVTGWLQMWGEADAWKYMDALHQNIAQYTHSGSQAVPPGGRRRVPDRHVVRVSRGHDQEVRRADRHHLPDRRTGLGPRGVGHHEDARRSSTRPRS